MSCANSLHGRRTHEILCRIQSNPVRRKRISTSPINDGGTGNALVMALSTSDSTWRLLRLVKCTPPPKRLLRLLRLVEFNPVPQKTNKHQPHQDGGTALAMALSTCQWRLLRLAIKNSLEVVRSWTGLGKLCTFFMVRQKPSIAPNFGRGGGGMLRPR